MKITKRQLRKIINENIFDDAYKFASDTYKFASDTYDSYFGSSEEGYKPGDIIEDFDDWGIYKEEGGRWLYKKKDKLDGPWQRLPAAGAANLDAKYKSGNSQTSGSQTDEESGPKIEYYGRLPEIEMKKFLPKLLAGRYAIVGQTDAPGCAEWVNRQTGSTKGNAWHMHRLASKTAFKDIDSETSLKLASIFSKINKNTEDITKYNNVIRDIVKNLVPEQDQYNNLNLGDIVGLFHYDSKMHAIAFFESGTGTTNKGEGSLVNPGPVFSTAEGTKWNKAMLGQDKSFKPNTVFFNEGLGLNTHVGIVGAKINDEPVIFHNISGDIYASPLSALKPISGRDAIVWTATGESIERKVIRLARSVYDTLTSLA